VTVDTFICRCCLSEIEIQTTYTVKSGDAVFIYLECSLCGSLTVINSKENFGYDDLMNTAGIEHYVEIGAGIDFMTELLHPLIELELNRKSKTYLELGCGFGFLIDYAKFIGFGNTVGVEDASYGKIGSEILGFNCEKLSDFESSSQSFDVVLACEVIEHVEEPLLFLQSIRDRLSKDGVVVITTPNSKFINKTNVDRKDSLTLAALSPGFHTCLFSPDALRDLLFKVGFKNVEIFIKHERLVVYASDNSNYVFNAPDPINSKKLYLDYLNYLTKNENVSVQVGSNLRIFKELVNRGVTDAKISEAYSFLVGNLGFPLLDFGKSEVLNNSQIDSLEEYRNHFRFHEGVFTFYASQYERNLGRPGMQIALLEKALSIIDRELGHFPQFFQESSSVQGVALERLEEALHFVDFRYFNSTQVPNVSLVKRWLDSLKRS
jgi:2-polyprenyl-3-methyl-5-hydroxy-6-metoxy-1,4-benzoquinol methylase